MSNITRQALRVYTSLRELGGKEGDVLDALIPFFDPVLNAFTGKVFDTRLFATGVQKLYGWRITADIVEQFIPRLIDRGHLTKAASAGRDTIYIVNYTSDQEIKDTGIEAIVEEIIDLFSSFPSLVSDILTYSKTREELKDILIRFLVSMDSHGEGAYAPELGSLEPAGEAQEILANLEEGGRPLDSNDRYICAKFVKYLLKRHPKYTEPLVQLASIALITEVVEDFLKPTTSEHKTELTIIVDAPLALDFLGCSGHALKEDISAILESLRSIGAKLVVFPITCEEMQRNLRSMLTLSPELRHGYTHNAMIKKEVNPDFVKAVANNPEAALAAKGVTVRQISLKDNHYLHKYFTHEQYEDFFSTVNWVSQLSAREHDATCAALTIRLREGRFSSDLFKSRYVIVTRNSKYVRHARNYCLQSKLIYEVHEPPVVHQRELATAAWLRTGLGQSNAIPRGHLIASCDRVLQLRPEVRRALAEQLRKVTSSRLDEFNLLMLDSRSVQKLSDQTFNDEQIISAENAEQLLDVIRLSAAEDVKQIYEDKLESERLAATEVSDYQNQELIAIRKQFDDVARREAHLKEQLQDQITGIISDLNKIGIWSDRLAMIVIIGLCVLSAIQWWSGALTYSSVWSIILTSSAAFGLYSLACNALGYEKITIRKLIDIYLEKRFKKLIEQRGLGDHIDLNNLRFSKARIERVTSPHIPE